LACAAWTIVFWCVCRSIAAAVPRASAAEAELEEIAELIEAAAPKPGRPATYKKRQAP
jgi:hypothetical protein